LVPVIQAVLVTVKNMLLQQIGDKECFFFFIFTFSPFNATCIFCFAEILLTGNYCGSICQNSTTIFLGGKFEIKNIGFPLFGIPNSNLFSCFVRRTLTSKSIVKEYYNLNNLIV
jgi:hypothetical protein